MGITDLAAGSERTVLLAPVVGAYLCLSAIGLLRKGAARSFLSDVRQHPAAMHAVGAVAFFVGGFILTWQRQWSLPADWALNLIACMWIFEGAGMLASPALVRKVVAQPAAARSFAIATAGAAGIGVYLIIAGLAGRLW